MDPDLIELLRTAGLADADCTALADLTAAGVDRAGIRGRLAVLVSRQPETAAGAGAIIAASEALDQVGDVPVTASGRLPNAAQRNAAQARLGMTPEPRQGSAGGRATLTAGGAPTTPETVAGGFADDLRRFRNSGSQRTVVASIRATYDEARQLGQDAGTNTARIAAVTAPDALTAAGGLCAPVGNVYDVEAVGTEDRPLRDALAGFQATRGGIQFQAPPTLAAVAGGVGVWTLADDEAAAVDPPGPTKAIVTVPCGSFATVNVSAITARASFGTFMERYSPEWVAAFLGTMRVVHARLAEQTLIAAMNALSVATTQASYLGASRDLLEAVERAAVAVRSRHRLADNAVMRVVLPAWARGMIRADLTRALPGDARTAVSDAEIEAHFAVRSISPVWTLDGQVFGAQAAGALLAWPTTVDVLVYPEGAFLHLDGGVLDLGMVRSPELNAVNQVESFAESFEAVALVGAQSVRITATVSASGASAGTVVPA